MVITTLRPGWRIIPALEFDQLQSVLDLEADLGPRQIPVRGDAVCIVAVEHDVHRARVDRYLARVRRIRRVCAVSARTFPFAGSLSAPASSSPIWCRRRCCSFRCPRSSATIRLGDTPWSLILTYPTFLDSVLHLADDGLLQGGAEGARGVRAHRRRLPLAGDALHRHSGGDPGHSVGRHLRFHAVAGTSSSMRSSSCRARTQKTVPVGVVSELIRDVFFWGPLMAARCSDRSRSRSPIRSSSSTTSRHDRQRSRVSGRPPHRENCR